MAERALATAFVNIVPGTKDFDGMLKAQLSGKMPALGGQAGQKFSKGFGGGLRGIATGLGLALGTGAVINFTKGLIGAAEEEIKGNKRLEAIATSMKLFGGETDNVVKRLEDYASAQQASTGIDDDVVKGTQAKLLTFAALAKTADTTGGAFDRATQAAIDLAAAGFGSAEGNAIQLGKALQDPVKGITALSRSGVTFTEAEKNRIKTLVESNRVGEAQNMVLKAIETQVGGTAKATSNAGDRMNGAWANMQETLGMMILPLYEQVAGVITDTVIPAIEDFITQFQAGTTPLNDIITGITGLIGFIQANWTWIGTLTTAVLGGFIAFKLWTGAIMLWQTITKIAIGVQLLFNAILAANPIMLVVIAVAALVAGLVFFFTQTKLGQTIWKNFTTFIGNTVKSIGGWFSGMWDGIVKTFNGIGKFIGGIFGVVGGLIKGYINIWIGLINVIIRGLNSLSVDIPDWVPGVGGQRWGLSIPQVPMLAKGGFVNQATTAVIGEAGPEVVTPLKDFERMMGLDKAQADQPIMADGMGLIGWMRREANGQAKIVFNTELGKTALGAR